MLADLQADWNISNWLVRSTSRVGHFQFVAKGAEHLQDEEAHADPFSTESMRWTEASELDCQANDEGKKLGWSQFWTIFCWNPWIFSSLSTWTVPTVLIVMEHYSLIGLCALCQLDICLSFGITSVISLEDLVAVYLKISQEKIWY